MSGLHHYTLRAASREALLDMLEAAQAGKARPFVTQDETGERNIGPSRIRYPYAEMTEAVFDPETGEIVAPSEPTGDWICEVWLTEPDAELAMWHLDAASNKCIIKPQQYEV